MKTTTTTETEQHLFTAEDVIEALRACGKIPPAAPGESVDVSVCVPGGGDWSEMRLDIGTDVPLEVKIQRQNTVAVS